jgi:hypothetical protein
VTATTNTGTYRCPACMVRTQPPGKLMCSRCWGKVPPDLQKAVYSTWRKWERDLDNTAAMFAYRAAAEAALVAV